MPFSRDFAPPLRRPEHPASRYLLALAIVGAATLLRLAADPVVHDQVPYVIYIAAVVVATWFCGASGGVLATVVATFAGNYFFVPARQPRGIRHEDVASMLIFGALSLALVWTVARWRRAETKMRQLQADTVAVLNQMPVGVMIADASGTLQFGNAAMETVFGRRVLPSSNIPEWRRHANYQPFFPDGRPMGLDDTPMARALTNGETVAAEELSIVRGDGSRRILSSYAAPVRNQENRTTGVVVAMLDVTEQKQAQEKVRESEERYSAIFENAPFAIALSKMPDGTVVSANDAFFRLFEYSRDEVIGKTSVELGIADPESHEKVRAAVREHGRFTGLEVARRTKSGAALSLLLSVTPLTLGAETFVVTMIEDITDRKRAEDALRESEARFRSVLDRSRDVIYRINLQSGRYEYISPSAGTMVGYSSDELAAMSVEASLSMIHPEDVPALRATMARALETGSEEAEYRQRTRTGDYRWMSNHMSLVGDPSGRPLFRDGNIRDVTEQKRLDDELRETVAELEHANHVKDEFLATLSHELRTPLNAILGWSAMLLRPGLPADIEQRALESINRNARAQAALISDILDVSRIITGKLRLDLRPVDLGDVVKAACESVQPAADAKGVAVRTVVESRPVLVGDQERLQQVLWNLLSNSVRFCDRGGTIEVDVRRVGLAHHRRRERRWCGHSSGFPAARLRAVPAG
jgi:PAS domain S-box-containing protein